MGGLVGGVVGAITGPGAARKAASQEQTALAQGANYLQGTYGQAQGNLQPYATAGQAALPYLLGFYGLPGGNPGGAQAAYQQFAQTPTYQFPLQQGNLALNRQLASAGLIGSGAALKDAIQFNQGYASQNLQNYLSGLSGIASAGQQAGTNLGQLGLATGQSVLGAYGNYGAAGAAGTMGATNALSQSLGQIGGSPLISGMFGNIGNWAGNQVTGLLGGGGSSYTGPSASALIGGQGTPAYLQGQLGLGANQYVP